MLEEGYKLKENYVPNNKCEQSVTGASDNSEYLDKTFNNMQMTVVKTLYSVIAVIF